MLQSEFSEKALETLTLIPHSESQGKQLIIGPSWCDREKRGLFRLAQSLPLRRPFSEMQPYALLAAPSLGIFLAVLMAFLSFHTAVGLNVRLLKPGERATGRRLVPTVVIRSSGIALDRKNVLYVNSTETSREELGVVVKREFGINSTNVTYLEAEGEVPWQTVADAIDVVNAIPADVVLVTKAPEKSHPRRTPDKSSLQP